MKPFAILAILLSIAGCAVIDNNLCTSDAIITSYSPTKIYVHNEKKVVLIGGCFDVLHYPHIDFMKKAREQGDYLVIALEPDEKIINNKKRQPIHTQQQRAHNLAAIRYVDEVLMLSPLNGFSEYNQLVKDIHPDIIAVTRNNPGLKNMQKQAAEIGAQVVIVNDLTDDFSSSKIIKALSD